MYKDKLMGFHTSCNEIPLLLNNTADKKRNLCFNYDVVNFTSSYVFSVLLGFCFFVRGEFIYAFFLTLSCISYWISKVKK